MTVQVDAQGRAVARASITDNVEPNIQILIAPEGQHETQDLSRLDVREIKDGHQPAFRADNYFLSKARTDNPILPHSNQPLPASSSLKALLILRWCI
jgi:hypothetical protein